ncbi:hypothetical protein BD408DRAFT_419503 [Parasitella parasitica]|nr:hypothetical protein BD408DRAFT_419503 [Parasitella parasitica]
MKTTALAVPMIIKHTWPPIEPYHKAIDSNLCDFILIYIYTTYYISVVIYIPSFSYIQS